MVRSVISEVTRGEVLTSHARGSIKRRHVATKANPVDTLQGQFSGYGSTSTVVARCLDRLGLKEPLEAWSDETVEAVVKAFIDEKFPTVYALNKIDHPDADKVCELFRK
jgi:ribosome-binding ATPase YchF (GTP1/OBG family)